MLGFVSAFERYAMKDIRSSAIDYILKPISIKELKGAAEKLEQLLELKKKNPGFEEGYADALKLMVQTSKQEGPMRIALPDFSGYHDFASDELQHMANARAYQRALDSLFGN